MKNAILLLLAIASLGHAENFTLADGSTVSGEIRRVEQDGIVIITESGIVKLKFSTLPAETASRFGFDPAKAAEFEKAQLTAAIATQQEAASAIRREQEKKVQEARAKALASSAEKKTFWGIQNWESGSIVHPSIMAGGGMIASGLSRVGGGGAAVVVPDTAYPSAEWVFLDGVRNLPMGDKITLRVYRDGSIRYGSQTIQRWVKAD